MRIFIDEAGSFVVPPARKSHSFSLVLALAVPSAKEPDLFYEFMRVRDRWPNPAVEIKGSTLNESQAAQLIDLVCHYDVLVNFFAIDMATHGDRIVDDFRMRQAAAVTAHLTSAHDPNVVAQLQTHASSMRAMPNQLFLQAFLTIELVLEVVEEATIYYVQRLPKELGEIAWFVDRKNRTITQMEEIWTTFILPAGESHFARNPLKTLIGADYSYFDARYGFTAETVDARMARHLDWIRQVHGTHPLDGGKTAVDATLLLSGRREFVDSRDSLGVQLADMLATILRRALNDHLQFPGWKDFGKLLVRKGQPGSFFLQLGLADGTSRILEGYAKKVCLALDARAKSMLINDDSV
jgi:hypothetical protein